MNKKALVAMRQRTPTPIPQFLAKSPLAQDCRLTSAHGTRGGLHLFFEVAAASPMTIRIDPPHPVPDHVQGGLIEGHAPYLLQAHENTAP